MLVSSSCFLVGLDNRLNKLYNSYTLKEEDYKSIGKVDSIIWVSTKAIVYNLPSRWFVNENEKG